MTDTPIKASFSVATDGETVTVTDTSVAAPGTTIDSVTFGWYDGAPSVCPPGGSVSHTYPNGSQRRITQTVTGSTVVAATSVQYVYPKAAAPAPVVIPPPQGATGSVRLKGTRADSSTFDVSFDPGERVPLGKDATGGSVVCHADGKTACIENAYAGLVADLQGHFTLSAGATQLFDGDLTIWCHSRTRPFELQTAPINPTPDLSLFPPIMPSTAASMHDSYIAAPNGPMDIALVAPGIGNEGPSAGLGAPDPQWAACYRANPTPENAAVVLGMSGRSAPWGCHFLDFATHDLLDPTAYPAATSYPKFRGIAGNPIAAYHSASPLDLDQGQTHAHLYSALACALFGRDYDREELAFRAMYYCSLVQSAAAPYRTPLGNCVFQHVAARGKARALNALLFAAKYAPDKWRPLFDSWITECGQIGVSMWVQGQTGIQIDQTTGGYHNGMGYAPWQQDQLNASIGLAILHGYGDAGYQQILDYFEPVSSARMLDLQHELGTTYAVNFRDANGTPYADWPTALRATAAADAKLAAALACAEDSQALQDALHAWAANAASYRPGDMTGYPWEATGYPAMARPGYVMLGRYATNQTRAQAALAKFTQWDRTDYSTNPKYALVPRGV